MSWGFLELLLAVACCNNSSDPMRFMGRPRLTKVVLESELTITMVYENSLVYDLKKKGTGKSEFLLLYYHVKV